MEPLHTLDLYDIRTSALDLGTRQVQKIGQVSISGSRAAFSILVLPSAKAAAIMIFSVAPTLGKGDKHYCLSTF